MTPHHPNLPSLTSLIYLSGADSVIFLMMMRIKKLF
jgi:hypothetical protein